MIHPVTGRSLNIWKDEDRLDRWCDQYELTMGVIRSPDRRAKYAALEQGLKPPPRVKQPKHHNDPVMKAVAANDNKAAKERAQAIKDQQRDYAARLKSTQDQAWKRRQAEQRSLWNDYRISRQAVYSRHQFQIDQIYKHKRNRSALPLSVQGFRDWKETREWTKLMERLKAEKRRFEYRERTLMGFVGNAIRLIRPGMERSGKGLLPVLFSLLVSGEQRRQLLHAKQELAKKALSEKQFGGRKARADKIRLVRDAQLAALSSAFDIQKAALDQRHAQEITAQKQDWRDLAAQRKELWEAWRKEFGVKPRQTERVGSGGESSGGARPRNQFPDAAKMVQPAPGATEKFLGAGKPVTRRAEPAQGDSPQPGYKKRRSAAERKADGSYKPRQRNTPKPRI